MDTDKTYNGFTNYETWAVSLWLGNDAGSYQYWRDATQEEWECAKSAPASASRLTPRETAAIALSQRLREEVEGGSPLADATLYTDLLQSALDQVDWYEVADNLLEDAQGDEQR
jgi:hypothetical protein